MSKLRTPDGTAYEINGREGAPVIVLIHGLGLCRGVWGSMVADFARDYRVVSYDLYGHGQSAPPPDTASLAVYARQIVNLLDALNIDKAHIVGFSIGGMINRRFALDYPERMASIAILNSPHDRGVEAQKAV